jgi:uncharacterized protein (UPF0303 family)
MSDAKEEFEAPSRLLEEEQELVGDTVDEALCYAIGSRIVEGGLRERQPLAVGVVLGERQVFHVGLPGTEAFNDMVMKGKWAVAKRGGHSSLYERNVRLQNGTTFEDETGLTFPEYAPFGGAVPVRARQRDADVAYVVVSGLTQEEDHALAVEAIRAALARTSQGT